MFRNLSSRRWRRRDERGQALVETAIILPVVMLLTFGAIELGLGFSQKGTLEAAVRTGARIGSAQHGDPNMPAKVANAVNSGLSGSSLGKLSELYVYKANGVFAGGPPADRAECVGSGECVAFAPILPAAKQFDPAPLGSWGVRHGCVNPDRVAVRIEGTFEWITGLISTGSLTLTADNIQQLEPTDC